MPHSERVRPRLWGGATVHGGRGKGRHSTGLQVNVETPGTHPDCSLCKVEPNSKSTDERWLLMETTDRMDVVCVEELGCRGGYRPIGSEG